MRPLLVVVIDVLVDRVPQRSLAEEDQTLGALGLDRANESLRVCVQVGAAYWKLHCLHAGGPEKLPQRGGVDPILMQGSA